MKTVIMQSMIQAIRKCRSGALVIALIGLAVLIWYGVVLLIQYGIPMQEIGPPGR